MVAFRKSLFPAFSIALSAAPAALLGQIVKESEDVGMKTMPMPMRIIGPVDCRQNDGLLLKRQKARECVNRYMAITGAPGVSIGVAKNGKTIWAEGFGYADVETGAKCTGESVMRIASISKPLTATIVGRLMERGKLDIDREIHEYLSQEDFPKKSFNGKEVAITTRQLLSHISGVRHYPKKDELAPDSDDPVEFMSNKRFSTVSEALRMFKDDPLLAAPGTEFHYTTHGYTLLSAVAEKAAGREFKEQLDELFTRLEMRHTFLDIAQEPIVVDRTRYYKRNDKTHRLENVREVDNSYKLAGGGILSNVGDLLKFANAILYSYQLSPIQQTRGSRPLLKSETIRKMWTKHSEHISKEGKKLGEYGLGWCLAYQNGWDGGEDQEAKENGNGGHDFEERKYWFHTGGAVGTSSALLIKPCQKRALIGGANDLEGIVDPQGICIVILVNCQNCPCNGLANELANIFEN